jgi:uncharacterized protein (DUF1499 family)
MVTKTGRWTSLLIWLSGLVLLLLPVSILGYRLGVLDLQLTFGVLAVIAIAGAGLLLVGVGCAIIGKLKTDKLLLRSGLIAVAICAFPVLIMGFQLGRATSLPPIHDISTDTIDPPVFVRAMELRGESENTLAYGTPELPAAELSALQIEAYPEIATVYSELSVGTAFDRALEITRNQGLEVINEDRSNGLIEAVATTLWFGFKDDLVIRFRADAGGSVIDLRSVSRLGKSDLGANAERIVDFVEAFNKQ